MQFCYSSRSGLHDVHNELSCQGLHCLLFPPCVQLCFLRYLLVLFVALPPSPRISLFLRPVYEVMLILLAGNH